MMHFLKAFSFLIIILYKRISGNNGELYSFKNNNIINIFNQNPIEELFINFENLIYQNSNPEIKSHPDLIDCKEFLKTSSNKENWFNVFLFSGMGIGSLGSEEECYNQKNMTYFLLEYEYCELEYYPKVSKSKYFFNKSDYYTGFCFFEKCIPAIKLILNNTVNPNFIYYLKEKLWIQNFKFIFKNEVSYNTNNTNSNTKNFSKIETIFFIFFTILTITIFLSMIFITFIKKLMYFSYQLDIAKEKERNLSFNQNKDNNNKNTKDKSDIIKNNSIFGKNIQREDTSIVKSTLLNHNIFHFILQFDLIDNIKIILSTKNKFYTNTSIELFCFLRLILMFFMVYSDNIYMLEFIPGQDQFNDYNYSSIWFYLLIRGGVYSNICWLFIDGAVFSYKYISYLVHYYNRQEKKTVPFRYAIRFILYSIPKILMFLYCFFYFYRLSDQLEYYLNFGLMFKYLNEKKLITKYCWKSVFEVFIPLRYNYCNVKGSDYSGCYKFVYIFQSEFYLMIFFVIIIFISFKLRSKIFDYCLLAILSINCIISYLSYYANDLLGEHMTINFQLTSKYTEKLTHLSFNIYFLGVITGICLFYYNDIINTSSFSQIEIGNLPFSYCFNLISEFDRLITGSCIKKLILSLLIILLILIPFSSYFFTLGEDSFNYKIGYFDIFIDIYGKQLFCIIFTLVILGLITYPKESIFKRLLSTQIFIVFERISTIFFCCSDIIISFIFSIFHIHIYVSYQNIFFLTFGIMALIIMFSFVIVIGIEVNLKKIVKFIITPKTFIIELKEEHIEEEEEEEEQDLDEKNDYRGPYRNNDASFDSENDEEDENNYINLF